MIRPIRPCTCTHNTLKCTSVTLTITKVKLKDKYYSTNTTELLSHTTYFKMKLLVSDIRHSLSSLATRPHSECCEECQVLTKRLSIKYSPRCSGIFFVYLCIFTDLLRCATEDRAIVSAGNRYLSILAEMSHSKVFFHTKRFPFSNPNCTQRRLRTAQSQYRVEASHFKTTPTKGLRHFSKGPLLSKLTLRPN